MSISIDRERADRAQAETDTRIASVATERDLVVTLTNGRSLSVPLGSFPTLARATPAQRANWRLLGGGTGIHWPDLDEDLSLAGLLRSAWPALQGALASVQRQRRGAYYVTPRDEGWEVRRSGSAQAHKVRRTQREAIADARKLARRDGAELVVHDADGRIREYRAYAAASSNRHG